MRARLGVAAATAVLFLSPVAMPAASAADQQPVAPSGWTAPGPVRAGIGDLLCTIMPWACSH